MDYEELLLLADSHELKVKEKPLQGSDGRILGKRIAIRKDISTEKEKACVLAEELGHYYTTSGDISDQTNINNQKQELRARTWAYNKQIGLLGIVKSYEHGCRNKHEMAEYLDVTEEFLNEALERYRQKYGLYTSIDNYIIYFEPCLGVVKMD